MKTTIMAQPAAKSATDNYVLSEASRPQCTGQIYHRILLAMDFSPASACVFEHGLKIARENGAELLIVHADACPSTLSFMPSTSYDEWSTHCRADSKKQIEGFVGRAHQEGIRCHALALTGFPDDAIIHAAQKLKVDLIVIGTHGRKGVSRFFSGSVATRVNSHAPCSVLTVHLPAK